MAVFWNASLASGCLCFYLPSLDSKSSFSAGETKPFYLASPRKSKPVFLVLVVLSMTLISTSIQHLFFASKSKYIQCLLHILSWLSYRHQKPHIPKSNHAVFVSNLLPDLHSPHSNGHHHQPNPVTKVALGVILIQPSPLASIPHCPTQPKRIVYSSPS